MATWALLYLAMVSVCFSEISFIKISRRWRAMSIFCTAPRFARSEVPAAIWATSLPSEIMKWKENHKHAMEYYICSIMPYAKESRKIQSNKSTFLRATHFVTLRWTHTFGTSLRQFDADHWTCQLRMIDVPNKAISLTRNSGSPNTATTKHRLIVTHRLQANAVVE